MTADLRPLCEHVFGCWVFAPGQCWGDPYEAFCAVRIDGQHARVMGLRMERNVMAVCRAIRDALKVVGCETATWERKSGGNPGEHALKL